MHLRLLPPTLISFLVTISSTIRPARSISIPILENLPDLSFNQIFPRQCQTPCGYYGQVCCAAGQYCYTDSANQAQCGSGAAPQTTARAQSSAAGGSYQMFTTTYVETDLKTVTSTFSSMVTSAAGPSCKASLGETVCGTTCCSAGQFCQAGQCVANGGGGSSGYYSSFYTVTTSTATGGAPLRPTSGTVVTVTSTGSATTTVPYVTPVGTDGGSLIGAQPSSSGGGLSGGAIAGIVIGVIAAIIILLLICACLCFKGLLDGLLGILGLRDRRRRRKTTYIEERRTSHHHGETAVAGSRYSDRERRGRRTWFGTRPGRVTERKEESRTGGGLGGIASVGAGLGALALALRLKRSGDKRKQDEKSETTGYGSSYYTNEYTTSASE